MSPRTSSRYVCQACGAVHARWSGQCTSCGQWNSIEEEIIEQLPGTPKRRQTKQSREIELHDLGGPHDPLGRIQTGLEEFDQVLGGGMVPGSAILIGGDPGIGKSTLLLQTACAIAGAHAVIYLAGEEGIDQIRLRARRLQIESARVKLVNTVSVHELVAYLRAGNAPAVLVVDSIQTVYVDALDSAPGTVSQVRAAAFELIRMAKQSGTVVIMIGHVTKDGAIAGPRVLEHMVDTVLYFEGERDHPFRILRAVKNRFGATDEIGVFDMAEGGLREVHNPSSHFLGERQKTMVGSCVFAGLEGTRPLFYEIQALVNPTTLPMPRRSVIGWDATRLSMVLAVLEARAGLRFSSQDVYLNVAGGLRIREPAADTAAVAALISARSGRAIPGDLVAFGEIGLAGDIRFARQAATRLREAEKLGFTSALIPEQRRDKLPGLTITHHSINHIAMIKDFVDQQPRISSK